MVIVSVVAGYAVAALVIMVKILGQEIKLPSFSASEKKKIEKMI